MKYLLDTTSINRMPTIVIFDEDELRDAAKDDARDEIRDELSEELQSELDSREGELDAIINEVTERISEAQADLVRAMDTLADLTSNTAFNVSDYI